MQFSFLVLGFLTLPTAYVTGNPVECVLHPDLWNKTELFDMSSGTVGKISSRMLEPDREDQYDEENYGYSVDSVRLIVHFQILMVVNFLSYAFWLQRKYIATRDLPGDDLVLLG